MIEFICTIPLIAGLLNFCAPPLPLAAGYAEGEYVLIAPVENARIETLDVARGEQVKAGQELAAMERRDAEIAVAQARAALAQADSQLGDLKHGRRQAEIEVIEATLQSARAQAAEAERVLQRQSDLVKRGISPQSALDDAQTANDMAKAAVAQAKANLAVARLPARPDQIAAATASVEQAQAALENAEWRLQQCMLTSPADGTITDIIRNPGEVAGPQAPILSMLPEGAVKLRLYVPEDALSSIHPGTKLTFRCDGCGEGMTATVTYVANDPEFTPPVIYSLESRQKLVWLIEARPDDAAIRLKPGQIVDADLASADIDAPVQRASR
jgi:HlyD family secretion protein